MDTVINKTKQFELEEIMYYMTRTENGWEGMKENLRRIKGVST